VWAPEVSRLPVSSAVSDGDFRWRESLPSREPARISRKVYWGGMLGQMGQTGIGSIEGYAVLGAAGGRQTATQSSSPVVITPNTVRTQFQKIHGASKASRSDDRPAGSSASRSTP